MHINDVLHELLNVLESITRTHHAWNNDLTQIEALAKIEGLRAALKSGVVHTDIVTLVKDAAEAAVNGSQESAQ